MRFTSWKKLFSPLSPIVAREDQVRAEASLRQPQPRESQPENPAAVEPAQDSAAEQPSVSVSEPTPEQQDHDISAFFRNQYVAKFNGVSYAAVCNGVAGDQYRNDRLYAAATKAANPAVIPENYRPRLIELLRPRTVVRRLPGTRFVPLLNGNLRIPRQATSSTANYVGEMVNIPESEPTTDQITLSAKKLTVMVVQSGELMRHASPSSDQMIRDDIVQALAVKEDSTFLRAAGSATVPGGIKDFVDDASNTIAANATVNIANVTNDLGKAILKLQEANCPMLNPVWILSPRSVRYLMDARDSNGNYAFPEMVNGRLREYPWFSSNQVPSNLGGGTNESEVYFLDASELIVGDAPTYELNVSTEAAYHDGANVQAAFSQDAAVFRLIVEHDTAMRHAESATYLSGVTWGS